MIQKKFAEHASRILEADDNVIGLAAAGSWITNEMDEFSDLDLILVTKERVAGDKSRMLDYAGRLGEFISGFTGDHVGEPRLLICLYKNPLLHVDIKFITLDEFGSRVENPTLLLDRDGQLEQVINSSVAKFPYPDYQWIEDRFWTWIHYALLKIGRGEYLEALDFLGFLRMVVLGPLMHVRNGSMPRGVRKVELALSRADLKSLQETIPAHNRESLLESLERAIALYRQLRTELFGERIELQTEAESAVMGYMSIISTMSTK